MPTRAGAGTPESSALATVTAQFALAGHTVPDLATLASFARRVGATP